MNVAKEIIKIIKRYGKKHQALKAVEEMAELIVELIKNINDKEENRKEIVEETADVYIMLHQLMLIYDISAEEFEDEINYKLLRQERRMKGEEDEKRE